MPRILSVRVVSLPDYDPDLSYLGEYNSNPDGDCVIDRQERGDMERNQFRYFHPAMTGEETGNPDSPEQDYQRCEAYSRCDWCMVGVRADAEVQLSNGGPVQDIRSGGLWGIESDSDKSYFSQVEGEELAQLRAELLLLGFSEEAIDAAFDAVESVEA